jgi:hypothetical protein
MSAVAIVGVTVLAIAFVWWMVHLERSYPKKIRPKVIATLEEAERLGTSDVESNFKGSLSRWVTLRNARQDPKRYQVLEYVERIDAYMEMMKPYETRFRQEMQKHAGIDLGNISSI